jgi:coenzyme A diphosphatase NUDT7
VDTFQQIWQHLQDRKPEMIGHRNLSKSAVLVPLVEIDGETHILFQERSKNLRRQPGEICFPGGRLEEGDEHELAAAVRETCEELGIGPEEVEPLGPLDYLVNPFQIVHPFVGRIRNIEKICPNPDEVESVFYVPLQVLRTAVPDLHNVDFMVVPPDDFPFHQIPNGRNYNWKAGKIPEYFYTYEDRVIWGLTARILQHFLEMTK